MAGASAGADYVMPTAEILTFATGNAGRMIDVTVAGDATDEPDEMVVFMPGGPPRAPSPTTTRPRL